MYCSCHNVSGSLDLLAELSISFADMTERSRKLKEFNIAVRRGGNRGADKQSTGRRSNDSVASCLSHSIRGLSDSVPRYYRDGERI